MALSSPKPTQGSALHYALALPHPADSQNTFSYTASDFATQKRIRVFHTKEVL
jgi:hypothetical protein